MGIDESIHHSADRGSPCSCMTRVVDLTLLRRGKPPSTLHRYSKIKSVAVPARRDVNEDRAILFGAEIRLVA